jgi:hypothetical protein
VIFRSASSLSPKSWRTGNPEVIQLTCLADFGGNRVNQGLGQFKTRDLHHIRYHRSQLRSDPSRKVLS